MTTETTTTDKKNSFTDHSAAIAELAKIKSGKNLVHKKDEGLDVENLDLPAQLERYCGIKPTGYSIIVRLHTNPQSTADNPLGLTDEEHAEQVFRPCIGLVLYVSPHAYRVWEQDQRYASGAWCKEGEFIMFPSTSGYYVYYDSQPLYLIKEHAVDAIIEPWAVKNISRKS